MDKAIEAVIVAVETGGGADPQPPLAVDLRVSDPVLDQRVGIVAVVLMGPQLEAIVAVEPFRGADPEKSLGILRQGPDRPVGQALLDRQRVEAIE